MRYPIETAPRNGNIVVLEDVASGTVEVARWSPTGEWIGEYGEPIQITPSHWHPCHSFFQSSSRGDEPQPPTASEVTALRSAAAVEAQIAPSHARWAFANSWVAAWVVAVVLVSTFIQHAVLHRHAFEEERARSATLASELVMARHETETTGIALSPNKRDDELAQLNQAADSATPELRQSLQQEYDRADAQPSELAQKRRAMEKPAAAEERRPAQQSEGVAPDNIKPEIKQVETAAPSRRAISQNIGYGCQHYRTYDPASGTYRGYDGKRRSCSPQAPSQQVNPSVTGSGNVAIGIRADFLEFRNSRQTQ
jgi:hypothetical protein